MKFRQSLFFFWGGGVVGGGVWVGGGWRGKHGLLVDPLAPVRPFECFSQNIILYFLLKVGLLVMERENKNSNEMEFS